LSKPALKNGEIYLKGQHFLPPSSPINSVDRHFEPGTVILDLRIELCVSYSLEVEVLSIDFLVGIAFKQCGSVVQI